MVFPPSWMDKRMEQRRQKEHCPMQNRTFGHCSLCETLTLAIPWRFF
jgi:hypothetical protein